MNELSVVKLQQKRKRYTKVFKQRVIAACAQPGASVARVALNNGLNANMLRKWIRLDQSKQDSNTPGFVALPMPSGMPLSTISTANQSVDTDSIRIQIPYREQNISISLPVSQMDRCARLLRELLQ